MNSKNKLHIGLAVLALLLFLCYFLAISITLETRKAYKTALTEEQLFENIPKQLSVLSGKQKHYDSILNAMNLGNTAMENNLLKAINTAAEKNNLKVIDFNPPHRSAVNSAQLNTYHFSLEGNFTSTLNAIYALEKNGNFGEVAHINFEKKRNYNSNRRYLQATVFMQQYE